MNSSESKSDRPLRVLLISCMPPPSGGIGRWSLLLLQWLAAKPEVSVSLLALSPSWRAVWDSALWKRVIFGVVQGFGDAVRVVLRLLWSRPDLVHLNSSAELRSLWDMGVLAVASGLGVRSVYHLHMGRLPEVIGKRGWEWWITRGAVHLADQVLVLDRNSEQALSHVLPRDRVARLPNAIAPLPDCGALAVSRERTVLYLGHIVAAKGMQQLMEAWRELRIPGWRLQLAGPGDEAYQEELRRMVGHAPNVHFLGELSTAAAWQCMQEADLFVLPTHTEGFPYVILEAMAAGKAIICSRVGAVPEMLGADDLEPCGLLIRPKDTRALADALRQLISDPGLRERLGKRAKLKLTTCYTPDTVFAQLLSLWRRAATAALGSSVQPLAGAARPE